MPTYSNSSAINLSASPPGSSSGSPQGTALGITLPSDEYPIHIAITPTSSKAGFSYKNTSGSVSSDTVVTLRMTDTDKGNPVILPRTVEVAKGTRSNVIKILLAPELPLDADLPEDTRQTLMGKSLRIDAAVVSGMEYPWKTQMSAYCNVGDIVVTSAKVSSKSTGSLDKASYSGGETAVLTITSNSQSYTHKYTLSFGGSMTTGAVDVAAGVTTVNIPVPVAWSLLSNGATSVTGGTLTLETYDSGDLIGTDTIQNLTYTALDSTIPSLQVWRTDTNGNSSVNGEYGYYSFVKPSSISTYSISYGQDSESSPSSTGAILPSDPLSFSASSNHTITLTLVYGGETITLSRDLPAITVARKKIVSQV